MRLKQTEVRLKQTDVRLKQTDVRLKRTEVRLKQTDVRLKHIDVHASEILTRNNRRLLRTYLVVYFWEGIDYMSVVDDLLPERDRPRAGCRGT